PGGTISRTNSPGSPSDRESSRILVDHNRIMVACRVRPRDDGGDNSKAQSVCVSVEDDAKTVAWAGDRGDEANARHFTFDYAAGENVGQEELFDRVGRPVTNACLEGFNGTIFCYGQTGSGKTYTTFGPPPSRQQDGDHDNSHDEVTPREWDAGLSAYPPDDATSGQERGLVPRVLEYLFDRFAAQ
ncbi:unnamed protein product, partial [Sphacelaria rigidula]